MQRLLIAMFDERCLICLKVRDAGRGDGPETLRHRHIDGYRACRSFGWPCLGHRRSPPDA